jgi:hypothetical protein
MPVFLSPGSWRKNVLCYGKFEHANKIEEIQNIGSMPYCMDFKVS